MRRLLFVLCIAAAGCPPSRDARSSSPTPSAAATPAAGACGLVRDEGQRRVYTDWIDRRVELAYPPQRIVSMAPNLTETLFAVGAGSQVVGVTKFCDYPAEAKALPNIGGFTDVSPEAVLALRPDLVFATADTSTRKRFEIIEASGQPTYAVFPKNLEDIRKMVRCVGEITGHVEQARELAVDMEHRQEAVRDRVAGQRAPRTLIVLQVQPLIAAGPDTFLDELVSAAGGQNIAHDAPVSWPRLDREWVITQDPEVVLTTFVEGVDELEKVLQGTSAARHGRVHALEPAWVERPGPRIVDGLDQIAELLHPKAHE